MSTLGEHLRSLRESRKLSLNDVEKAINITTTRLNRIEHNVVNEPSPRVLSALADFYDISIIDLYIRAGYLPDNVLNICPKIFNGIEHLSDDDRKHIQQQIDYLIKKHD